MEKSLWSFQTKILNCQLTNIGLSFGCNREKKKQSPMITLMAADVWRKWSPAELFYFYFDRMRIDTCWNGKEKKTTQKKKKHLLALFFFVVVVALFVHFGGDISDVNRISFYWLKRTAHGTCSTLERYCRVMLQFDEKFPGVINSPFLIFYHKTCIRTSAYFRELRWTCSTYVTNVYVLCNIWK